MLSLSLSSRWILLSQGFVSMTNWPLSFRCCCPSCWFVPAPWWLSCLLVMCWIGTQDGKDSRCRMTDRRMLNPSIDSKSVVQRLLLLVCARKSVEYVRRSTLALAQNRTNPADTVGGTSSKRNPFCGRVLFPAYTTTICPIPDSRFWILDSLPKTTERPG